MLNERQAIGHSGNRTNPFAAEYSIGVFNRRLKNRFTLYALNARGTDFQLSSIDELRALDSANGQRQTDHSALEFHIDLNAST
jgi:hypothetical protein